MPVPLTLPPLPCYDGLCVISQFREEEDDEGMDIAGVNLQVSCGDVYVCVCWGRFWLCGMVWLPFTPGQSIFVYKCVSKKI